MGLDHGEWSYYIGQNEKVQYGKTQAQEIIPYLIKHGYTVLFVWVFAETIGLPLPSAPRFITVGALAGMGHMHLPICIALGVCAALLCDFSGITRAPWRSACF
jgi:membrane protein DedA with SNARE-associated domain